MQVKHGGCKQCGSKEEPVLTSVITGKKDKDGKTYLFGEALCSRCLKPYEKEIRQHG